MRQKHVYGTTKDLVTEKEDIKFKYIIGECKND